MIFAGKMVDGLKRFLYGIIQCTWGLPQTLLGFAVFLWCRRSSRSFYHGALVTEWKRNTGLSLGLFLFVPRGKTGQEFLVHEYGHTIQSLFLGPLYLFLIGIPSAIWCNLSWCDNMRKKKELSYHDLYTERWANRLGERTTGEKAKI